MSDSDAIVARELYKSYAEPDRSWAWRRRGRIRGVSGLSFTLRRGGSLAIVGRNGAGKSTLLRMLAGLSRPSSGELHVYGRVGSLLDLGAGFVEEWSGDQNARGALALLGLPPARLSEALRFVARFSELGDFLERPVRIYSAGMRLRLAYSIAIATEPELLIADEVLSVGDEGFQRKCSHHILGHLARGGTMVLATHNLYQAERLCSEAIWLEGGCARLQGGCHEVTKGYRATIEQGDAVEVGTGTAAPACRGSLIRLEGAARGEGGVTVPFGATLRMTIDGPPGARLEIRRIDGTLVSALDAPRRATLELQGPALLPGRYAVRLVATAGAKHSLDEVWVDCAGERRELGTVFLEHQWV